MVVDRVYNIEADGEKRREGEGFDIKPNMYERAMVKYPCACCWGWFAFSLVVTMISQALMASGSLKFDESGVWDVRSSEIQTQFDAFTAARQELSTNESEHANFVARSQPMLPLHIVVFGEEGQNMLDKDILETLRGVEEKVMVASGMQDHCQLVVGVDASAAPITFTSLDASTDVITASATPADGSEVIFRGTSTDLVDGGKYHVKAETGGFSLYLLSDDLGEVKVELAANGITSGTFFAATKKCVSTQSVTNFAFPSSEAQSAAICAGYVRMGRTTTSIPAVSVMPEVCGCPSDKVVSPSGGTCSMNCTGAFGSSPMCISPAFVTVTTDEEQAQINSALAKFCPEYTGLSALEEPVYKGNRRQILPAKFQCPDPAAPSSNLIRSVVWIGGPVEGYTKIAGSSVTAQVTKLMSWASGTANGMGQSNNDGFLDDVAQIEADANKDTEGKATFVIMGSFLLQAAYFKLMAVEGMFALGSMWFVWMWVWCATGSALLATCTIYETVISLPMSMATWGLLGQGYVGFLCIMMLFVIVGIGADAVFVLFDAWKQSGQLRLPNDLDGDTKRFAWAFRRASGAIATTTITTIFCFLAAGFADIPTISGFGFFAALVVWWDFFLVITFFAAALMVYHFHFEKRNICCLNKCWTGHMLCCPCKSIMYDSQAPLWKQAKIVGPFGFFFVLGLVLVVTKSFVLGGLMVSLSTVYIHAQVSSSVSDDAQGRPIEILCEEKLFPLLQRHAKKFLAAWVLVVLASTVLIAAGLRLPKEQVKFLAEDNPIQKYLDSTASFMSGGDKMMETLNVVIGLNKKEALNRDGVDYQTPGTSWGQPTPEVPLGVVQYDASALGTFLSSDGQQEVLGLCDDMRVRKEIANSDDDCHLVVHRGVVYPRSIAAPASLTSSGVLAAASDGSGATYYKVQGSRELSEAGIGFCSTGVYCFMYDVRAYILDFCAPGSGLKAQTVAAMGSAFSDLCKDDAGSDIQNAFPSPTLKDILESRGFKLYHTKVARLAKTANGMGYADFATSHNTGIGISPEGDLKFAWLGINASFPRGVLAYEKQVKNHELFDNYFRSKLLVNTDAFMTSFIFNWMLTVEALLRNTIQSVIMAVVFCWLVLVVTTWNIAVGSLAVLSVFSVVTVAGGMIVIMGWSLGIIESIACIVIIGISVDYSVHIAHAYNIAKVQEGAARQQEREDKAKSALSTIGISLVSGCITSLGSTIWLMFCQINFFGSFGTFLFVTLVISFLVAFLLLIPLFVVFGPGQDQGKLPRVPLFLGNKKTETES